jgi:hypothetical protein
VHGSATSTHATQVLNALNARWKAQADAYRIRLAEQAQARAVFALDRRWQAQAAAYKSHLSAAQALRALNARWNAEAVFFGLR